MGETGCGKTRLIRFMCELQAGPEGPKNMLLMKVCIFQNVIMQIKDKEQSTYIIKRKCSSQGRRKRLQAAEEAI